MFELLFQEAWDRQHKSSNLMPRLRDLGVKILRDRQFNVDGRLFGEYGDETVVRNGRVVVVLDLYNDGRDRPFRWMISFPEARKDALVSLESEVARDRDLDDVVSVLSRGHLRKEDLEAAWARAVDQ